MAPSLPGGEERVCMYVYVCVCLCVHAHVLVCFSVKASEQTYSRLPYVSILVHIQWTFP
jgi:hypothetical protein